MKNIEKLPKETNRDYALRVITDNIINLNLTPGSMISEQEIADELDLSRTPVHEAMLELSKTKVVEVFPQKGSKVSLINTELIDEAVFIRSTLESALIEEATKIATEEDIQNLKENVELQEFYHNQGNIDKIMELDNKFHEYIYKITNKMQCYYMVKMFNIHYDRFRKLKLETSDRGPVIEEHKQIYEALKNKDGKLAKELCIQHLQRMHIDEKDLRKKHPEFFL